MLKLLIDLPMRPGLRLRQLRRPILIDLPKVAAMCRQ
jgi:hypothetical protein